MPPINGSPRPIAPGGNQRPGRRATWRAKRRRLSWPRRHDDLAADVPALEVTNGLGGVGERVRAVDHRRDVVVLDELRDQREVVALDRLAEHHRNALLP